MIQVATSTTENSELAATVSEIVTRIDAVHSTLAHQPLVFLRQDIAFSQYLALLSVADVLMITSLREGMNLTCHEFVFCQDGNVRRHLSIGDKGGMSYCGSRTLRTNSAKRGSERSGRNSR